MSGRHPAREASAAPGQMRAERPSAFVSSNAHAAAQHSPNALIQEDYRVRARQRYARGAPTRSRRWIRLVRWPDAANPQCLTSAYRGVVIDRLEPCLQHRDPRFQRSRDRVDLIDAEALRDV